MKRILIAAISALTLNTFCFAEPEGSFHAMEDIEAKIKAKFFEPDLNPMVNRFEGLTILKDRILSDLSSNGPTVIENVTIEGDSIINGPTTIEKATFNNLDINGPVEAKNVLLNEANINGPVNLDMTTAKSDIKINGPLVAKSSHFYDLTVNCSEMTLEKSTVVNLIISDNNDLKNQKQILYLKDGSFIKGKIKFLSGKGVVMLMNSKLPEEKLDGGEIVFQN